MERALRLDAQAQRRILPALHPGRQRGGVPGGGPDRRDGSGAGGEEIVRFSVGISRGEADEALLRGRGEERTGALMMEGW